LLIGIVRWLDKKVLDEIVTPLETGVIAATCKIGLDASSYIARLDTWLSPPLAGFQLASTCHQAHQLAGL
jgi:hypothetical protein